MTHIKTARKLGAQAFMNGIRPAPINDAALLEHIDSFKLEITAICTAWMVGYNSHRR